MHLYAIALGSNRRHGRHGAPKNVLCAAIVELGHAGLAIRTVSPVFRTAAVGPGGRSFANATMLAESDLPPRDLLSLLKQVERNFGRRRGRRWGARVLDLDILLWSGGAWTSPDLQIPHAQIGRRRFVLDPLVRIAADWRLGRASVRQLHARLTRPRPLHRAS